MRKQYVSRNFIAQFRQAKKASTNYEHMILMINKPMYRKDYRLLLKAKENLLHDIYYGEALMVANWKE
ncbi:hypothetical protein WS105_0639 [Weissella ceti]|nr:hypothetical protein WS105_0639 [Weissella ceti]